MELRCFPLVSMLVVYFRNYSFMQMYPGLLIEGGIYDVILAVWKFGVCCGAHQVMNVIYEWCCKRLLMYTLADSNL